jgi:hypothetical protein
MLTTSKVLSKHFVVLHESTPGTEEVNYPKLEYAAMCKVLAVKRGQQETANETFEKTRKEYKEGPEGVREGGMET